MDILVCSTSLPSPSLPFPLNNIRLRRPFTTIMVLSLLLRVQPSTGALFSHLTYTVQLLYFGKQSRFRSVKIKIMNISQEDAILIFVCPMLCMDRI